MNLIKTTTGIAVQTPSGPFPLRQILAIGRNYAEHAKEQAAAVLTRPMIFYKNISSLTLNGEDVVIPPICHDPATGGDQMDFEAELAVVIGRDVKNVPAAQALSFVLGYCCANDVSARWWQKEGSGGQYCRGKSFDTFCPLGPRLVPAAEIPDPQALRIACRVNGAVMQDASTGDMLFPIATLLADLSRGMTIPAGTVLLTGTPGGVGMARKPPVWLKNGDTVEVEIEKIGVLKNRIRFE
jgi:2-keto-4-pentenoate hydratase/2-oxohepta-3-ene-1,7-dioic acid hydratase in catechol pathway